MDSVIVVKKGDEPVRQVDWWHDGGTQRLLARDRTRRVFSVDPESGATVVFGPVNAEHFSAHPSRDGVIAVTVRTTTSAAVMLYHGDQHVKTVPFPAVPSSVAWHPRGGSKLAVALWNGSIHVLNGDDEEADTRIDEHTGFVDIEWCPRGERLASCGTPKSTSESRPTTAVLIHNNSDHRIMAISASDQHRPAWSPENGNHIAVVGDGGVKICDAVTTGERVALYPVEEPVTCLAWGGADGHIAFGTASGEVVLFEFRGGKNSVAAVRALQGHTALVEDMAWAKMPPHHLATASVDATVRVWPIVAEVVVRQEVHLPAAWVQRYLRVVDEAAFSLLLVGGQRSDVENDDPTRLHRPLRHCPTHLQSHGSCPNGTLCPFVHAKRVPRLTDLVHPTSSSLAAYTAAVEFDMSSRLPSIVQDIRAVEAGMTVMLHRGKAWAWDRAENGRHFVASGQFGSVYEVREVVTPLPGAAEDDASLSYIHPEHGRDTFVAKFIPHARSREAVLRREREAAALFKHPHILPVVAVFARRRQRETVIVSPFMVGGDLQKRLLRSPARRISPTVLVGWLGDVASAIGHVHSLGWIHRDVKPENILFDEEDRIFLGDFGLARRIAEPDDRRPATPDGDALYLTRGCGTPALSAPEVVACVEYGFPCDAWSMGMTFAEAFLGYNPIQGPPHLKQRGFGNAMRFLSDLAMASGPVAGDEPAIGAREKWRETVTSWRRTDDDHATLLLLELLGGLLDPDPSTRLKPAGVVSRTSAAAAVFPRDDGAGASGAAGS